MSQPEQREARRVALHKMFNAGEKRTVEKGEVLFMQGAETARDADEALLFRADTAVVARYVLHDGERAMPDVVRDNNVAGEEVAETDVYDATGVVLAGGKLSVITARELLTHPDADGMIGIMSTDRRIRADAYAYIKGKPVMDRTFSALGEFMDEERVVHASSSEVGARVRANVIDINNAITDLANRRRIERRDSPSGRTIYVRPQA